ncbi:NADH-quinone oxidoreductase subunit L [Marinobacter sp. CHS3-4]|uniref:NADH-quinone oxidoreductase subunit L n=1 Tax=Marinobacter sp. CHS3-4 TaxID=3045174 RepID=UPI0024B5BF79|nr:NADH-quinone oxidoreductase subunit L [Marinobacter sp. CHS3-4]MDI9246399.1 NADH-quinone oxidoreductase subunit L [Marinobacter sp. CHS3-4]
MTSLVELINVGLLAAWLTSVVGLLLLAAVAGYKQGAATSGLYWRIAQNVLLAVLCLSVAVGIGLILEANLLFTATLRDAGGFLGLYPDGLAVWMAIMVSFIGWVILRFADSYLRDDPGRQRFLPWLLVIIGSVCVLVFTNHLMILACAWVAVSLALHHLLTLYGERPQARLAAVQKFIVSRIADALVLAGVGLLYSHHGTFLLPEIVASTASGGGTGEYPWLASIAFALAAVLKCAQIPFHGWLLRVMEAPTPVSALLHAGVINLGGFLWLRLFPVFDGFTSGHLVLLVVGGSTAVIAVLTMMTQSSVKHALAWSTCAQMGFMLFEIGMGAYTLALLHLLAHSLYKAHSFLASGRTVSVSSKPGFPATALRYRLARAGLCALAAMAIIGMAPQLVQNNPVLAAVLILAVSFSSYGIPSGISRLNATYLCILAVALIPGYWLLHFIVAPAIPAHAPVELPLVAYAIGSVMVTGLLLGTAVTQLSSRYEITRTLCTHFRSGLYLEQPFDRLTRGLAIESLRMPTLLRPVPKSPSHAEEQS